MNRLIQDTFTPMDDNFDDIHDAPLIDKEQKPLYEGLRTNLLAYIVVGELEGIEWFVKHLSHTYPRHVI